jgi:hypothetical protein
LRYNTGGTRRRLKARFFIILGAVLAVTVMVVVIVMRAQATSPVEWGAADFRASYSMLIIRTEVVYEGKNYGKTDFIAEEGQRVAAGDEIAEVYSWQYNDGTISQLLDLQAKILDYEVGVSRAGVIDEKLTDINGRIAGKVDEIEASVAKGRPQDALSLQRELEALLDERIAYLRSVVVPDNTLRGYYSDEEALLKTIDEWRIHLTAGQNGVVSFYFDGCEALMAPDNIGSFTRAALEEVAAGKTIKTEKSEAGFAPLYRIVDTTDWYVVMYSAEAIPEMHEGNAFSLMFDDYLDNQVIGVVYNATLEKNGGFVYTIRIRDDIGPLIGERRVVARLYGEQEGLRIPKRCVQTARRETEDGKQETYTYVETEDGQYVPVFLIADDGDHYLVRTYEGQGSLGVGQRVRG